MVEIYINEQKLDAPDGGFSYSSVLSIADHSKLTVRKGYVTKTITIPASKRNRLILGLPEDLNVTSAVSQTINLPARIENDGVTEIQGAFKITDVEWKDVYNAIAYKGVIVANNADWKLLIGDKELKDVDLSDQSHTFDKATVDASETLQDGRDYVYPLINYGDINPVELKDRYPATRVARLVRQMFQDVNYKLVSNFFDSDFGKRLFMPFTNAETKIQGTPTGLFRADDKGAGYVAPDFELELTSDIAYNQNFFFTSENAINIPFDTEIKDTTGFYNLSINRISSPSNGDMVAQLGLNFELTNNPQNAQVDLYFSIRLFGIAASNKVKINQTPITATGNYGFVVNGLPQILSSGNTYEVLLTVKASAGTTGAIDYKIKAGTKLTSVNWMQFDSVKPFMNQGQEEIVKFDNDSTGGSFDPDNVFIFGNKYQPTERRKVNQKVKIDVINIGNFDSNVKIRWMRLRGGVLTTMQTIEQTITQDARFAEVGRSDKTTIEFESGFSEVLPGDQFYFTIQNIDNQFYSIAWGNNVFSNEISSEIVEGDTVDLSLQLPEMKQVDFLAALKTLFNLQFFTDTQQRIVYCEPFDDFFTGEIVDWTDKFDLDSKVTNKYIGDELNRSIIFRYSEDSNDDPVEEIRSKRGVFEEEERKSNNVFAKDGTTEITTEFAPTFMDTNPDIGLHETLIPKMWSDNTPGQIPEKRTEWKPRILYYNGKQPTNGNDIWNFEGDVRNDYPQMLFYDENTDNNFSLVFRTLRRSHGLFEKYHRNSFKLFNEGRILKGKFRLTPVDISELDFRRKVLLRINGEPKTFILSRVNYTPGKLSTVELITDVGQDDLTNLTTLDDDASILPSDWTTTKSAPSEGLLTIINDSIVPVYSEKADGTIFWVQK